MKVLVISDLHLSKKFDLKKFKTLKELIERHDKVVIVGDFWDSWLVDFNVFINCEWSKIFPFLKSKKAVYVFGNHDPRAFCDERIERFCIKGAEKFEMEVGSETYTFIHGDELSRSKLKGFKRKYFELVNIKNNSYLGKLLRVILTFLSSLVPGFLFDNAKAGVFLNEAIKQNKRKSDYLVCGDSHVAEVDKTQKFINCGFWGRKKYSYVTISEQGPEIFIKNY